MFSISALAFGVVIPLATLGVLVWIAIELHGLRRDRSRDDR